MTPDVVLQIISGLGLTLAVTGLSMVCGAIGGLPLIAARRSGWAPLRVVSRVVVDVVRAIPPITWLFMIFFGLPSVGVNLDPLPAAVVGFTIIASAYFAEIYRSGLLGVDRGQWEAGTALGMPALVQLRWVVGPQAFKVLLPATAAYAIALLKDSALASTIGVQDVTYQAGLASRQTHDGLLAFAVAGLVYIAVSVPLAVASRRVDATLRLKLAVGA